MKSSANVVIIGGGVNGLGIAYRLAKLGMDDVVVLEKGYIGCGASGRNGGGVRQQWSTKENIILARESVKIFEQLSEELNYNIFFRQGGYLILAFTEQEVQEFKKNVKLQNSLGVKSKYIELEEIREIVPQLNIEKILGATFCPTDGVVFPYPVLWGYAKRARELGVEINTFTTVLDIKTGDGKIKSVMTDRGEIKTSIVVNAAGGYSAEIAKMAGIDIPNKPVRHHALVTEPLKPFLEPMILSFKHKLWINQVMRGELIGGVEIPEKPSYSTKGSIEFLESFARATTEILPAIKYIKVLRQWAGLYDMTPDGKPILGEVDELEGFIQANGFSGHGFMLSPMVAKLIAELIAEGKPSMPIDCFNLRRFENLEIEKESWIVG